MRSAILVGICALLAGCAATTAARGSQMHVPLLPPASLAEERSATQRLRAAFDDQDINLECAISVTADRIVVIGLLPSGPRVFTVSYDGEHVETETSRNVPAGLEPEFLLNDLQLAFWPQQALEQALEHTPWQLTQPDSQTRRLRREGRLIAEVHYVGADPWTGRLWLVNFERSYSLMVDSQPVQ